ncbi:DegV family protein [Deinococcus misasensis]|uniref:DegV family protein n=1 Tax=Deinococcus misasensis TaxID=392413 RepID=UPI00055649DD|nr:DegV family protein [Deinococcus misasensis]
MTQSPLQAAPFEVVADGGLDRFPSLLNGVRVAPFSISFGSQTFSAADLSRADFFKRLRQGTPHPTTSQPTPEQFRELFEQSPAEVLAVTISQGLSGSLNAATQALSLISKKVTLHSSGTLSAAQAFQVHAAMMARSKGQSMATAVDWMKKVHQQTELFFTIDTLEYLRRGGRIGRVQATLGGLLNLKPIITVDKATGTYSNVGRARSWEKAIEGIAALVTSKHGKGTPLRVGLLYGEETEGANLLLERLKEHHPILWNDLAPVGVALAVHTGPRAVGLAVAAGPWPWEG